MHRRFNFSAATTSHGHPPRPDDQSRLRGASSAPSFSQTDETRNSDEVVADRAFLRGLCQGQSDAWCHLLEIWSPRLYSYVFYNTYTEGDAQALLQRTFAIVMQRVINDTQRLESFSQLSVLLVSTLYNLILHYQQQFGVPLFAARHPQQQFDRHRQKFLATLQQLTPTVQQLLLLRYLVGLSVDELALITGYGIAAVVVILRAAALHFPPATVG